MNVRTKIILGAILCFVTVSQLIRQNKSSDSYTLKMVIEQMNRECPMRIDSLNSISGFTYLEPDTMVINYILSGTEKDLIDIEATKKAFRPQLDNDFNSKIKSGVLPFEKIFIAYRYYDKNNIFLFEVVKSASKKNPLDV